MANSSNRGRPILVFLPTAERLAKKIYDCLDGADGGWQLMPAEPIYQGDGEAKVVLPKGIEHSVREADTFLIQTPLIGGDRSPQDLVMELLFGIDTLAGCGARKRTVILPWYFYACQDKTWRREVLSASWLARAMTGAGAQHVISSDVHNDGIEMAFDRRECTFNHLYTWWTMFRHLEEMFKISEHPDQYIFTAVDVGGSARINYIGRHTGLATMIAPKRKDHDAARATAVDVDQRIDGLTAVIVDDMLRSGSTVEQAIPALMDAGAKDVIVVATHPNFCKGCVGLLDGYHEQGVLKTALFTDSIALPGGFAADHPWFQEVSQAPMLADAISCIHEGKSVGAAYLDEPIPGKL